MKKILITSAVLLLCAVTAHAATLTYSLGASSSSYNRQELDIVATEGSDTIWEMTVWTPITGTNTTHSAFSPGQITSFVDTQYGGGYDYSGENAYAFAQGLMQFHGAWGSVTGASYADTQNAAYYEFSWTLDDVIHCGSATDPNNTIDAVITVRINAPTVSSPTGYTTDIAASIALTNNQAAAQNLWFCGSNLGTIDMDISGAGGTFTNPLDTPESDAPNVHTGEHPLFLCKDWYGNTDTGGTGLLMSAEVLPGNEATMRPGLKFEIEAPWMDFYYNVPTSATDGNTTQDTGGTDYIEFNVGQAGAAGSGVYIQPNETLTFDSTGLISAPVPEPATMGLLGLGLLGLVIRRRK
jgi:hypothetical protein